MSVEDINAVVIVGRLTRDIDLAYTTNGFPIGNMSIAVNRSVKKGDQWEDKACFYNVTFLGKRAESLAKYLLKGTRVAIEGELDQDRWEKDGQKHEKTKIIVNKIQLLDSKKPEQGSGTTGNSSPPPKREYVDSSGKPVEVAPEDEFEDDLIDYENIPF
jgi:single-strand DNA-binding protein